MINVANPAAPVAGASINLAGFPVTMQVGGNSLFIAADTAGLLTYSIANPAAPALLSQYRPSSAVEGVAVDGNLALLAATDGGFVIADMTNPAAPVLAGQMPLDSLSCFADLGFSSSYPLAIVSVSINNGIAYLGTANIGGKVFGLDYRQPAHPRLVSAVSYGTVIADSVLTFAFSGPNAFVAGDFSGDLIHTDSIFIVDITQPRNFIRHMCLPPPFGSNSATVFPEVKRTPSVSNGWNFKANPKKL